MNIKEYEEIKNLDYESYCKYLQNKYGIPKKPYFANENMKSKTAIKRTKEGLFIHHIKEDIALKLADNKVAINYPFEYQLPENLCYCNYLEHTLLHIKISKKNNDFNPGLAVYLVPTLTRLYLYKLNKEKENAKKGAILAGEWEKEAYEVIKDNMIVYQRMYEDFEIDGEVSSFLFDFYEIGNSYHEKLTSLKIFK